MTVTEGGISRPPFVLLGLLRWGEGFCIPVQKVFYPCGCGRPPAAHFSQQLEKWAKEPEETNGFFTSLRAIRCTKPRLPTTRSRKLFFFALLKGSTLLQRRCR